ncbi:hypothetical protein GCM10010320_72730 [Streptomyces caelestis]|nr:hypothetical protein GCM10010320_72730 [Streptomyces caelestis]
MDVRDHGIDSGHHWPNRHRRSRWLAGPAKSLLRRPLAQTFWTLGLLRLMEGVFRGTCVGMEPETDHTESVRALRQLRRMRTFYAGGSVLWGAAAALAGWDAPGSRQMWVSVLLLVVFVALLSMTSLWLWRQQAARSGESVRHAAPRREAWRRHANA